MLGTRSSAALKAENILLRKQLALYLEREAKVATGEQRDYMIDGSALAAFCMGMLLIKRAGLSSGVTRSWISTDCDWDQLWAILVLHLRTSGDNQRQ